MEANGFEPLCFLRARFTVWWFQPLTHTSKIKNLKHTAPDYFGLAIIIANSKGGTRVCLRKILLYYDLRPVASLNFLRASASSDASTRNLSLPNSAYVASAIALCLDAITAPSTS